MLKNHYMLFGLSKKKKKKTNEVLYINNEIITNVKSTKFLGGMIDCKISWTEHIYYIKCNTSKGIGILCKARKVLKQSTLLCLYYCFIYPYFTYCIEVGVVLVTPIYLHSILQKKILRIIQSTSYKAHTAPIFLKVIFTVSQCLCLHFSKVYYSIKCLLEMKICISTLLDN